MKMRSEFCGLPWRNKIIHHRKREKKVVGACHKLKNWPSVVQYILALDITNKFLSGRNLAPLLYFVLRRRKVISISERGHFPRLSGSESGSDWGAKFMRSLAHNNNAGGRKGREIQMGLDCCWFIHRGKERKRERQILWDSSRQDFIQTDTSQCLGKGSMN